MSESTHEIYSLKVKPSSDEINKMLSAYYSEQAESYDSFDKNHIKRNLYNEKINDLIAEDLKSRNIKRFLNLACGTGKRVLKIREKSGLDYEITGVDISEEMCKLSKSKGINVFCGPWIDIKLTRNDFDGATFLYAFGHIPSEKNRKLSLLKMSKHLNVGAPLYLDVFNINDKNEWGSEVLKNFNKSGGYEKGDTFYRKIGSKEIAFLHYFEETEIVELLENSGFEVKNVKYIGYNKNPGEILKDKNGKLFITAIKK